MSPYPGPMPRPSIFEKAVPYVKSLRLRGSDTRTGIALTPVLPARPLSDSDIPLMVVSRNDGHLTRAFLKHYRSLGVTRFLWVDDASDDETADILAAQPDVDLFQSNVRFKEAKRGRAWREMLVDMYGRRRWYLSVDADEFLVYRNSERVQIPEVIAALERRGVKHCAAPMLDLYPAGDLSCAKFSGRDERMPWEIATHFDAAGYSIRRGALAWKIEGGVRKRVFGSDLLLTKYPLLYWTRLTGYPRNIHMPVPSWRNFAPPMGVLLHFKFFADYQSRFKAAVSNAQHFRNGAFYGSILEQTQNEPQIFGENSAPFAHSEDLFRRGFFTDWDAPPG